jgi:hypothetical protein
MSSIKIVILVNFLSETCKLSQIWLNVLGQVQKKVHHLCNYIISILNFNLMTLKDFGLSSKTAFTGTALSKVNYISLLLKNQTIQLSLIGGGGGDPSNCKVA